VCKARGLGLGAVSLGGVSSRSGRSVLWLLFADFAIQAMLHVIPMLHLPGLGFAHGPRSAYVGLLCYEADNFSYAAWAAQAQRGHVLLTDLFTTEPHAAVLFNPYFLLVGFLAWLAGSNPMVVMVVLGVVAAPLLGLLVDRIAAALRFSARARFLAVTLVLFGTGPSAILRLFGWGGIDASYFDLFPATMVSFPYQAAAAAGAACSLLLMCRMWNSQPGRRMAWVAGCGLAVGVLSLSRPYLLPCLALMLLVSVVLMPGGRADGIGIRGWLWRCFCRWRCMWAFCRVCRFGMMWPSGISAFWCLGRSWRLGFRCSGWRGRWARFGRGVRGGGNWRRSARGQG